MRAAGRPRGRLFALAFQFCELLARSREIGVRVRKLVFQIGQLIDQEPKFVGEAGASLTHRPYAFGSAGLVRGAQRSQRSDLRIRPATMRQPLSGMKLTQLPHFWSPVA